MEKDLVAAKIDTGDIEEELPPLDPNHVTYIEGLSDKTNRMRLKLYQVCLDGSKRRPIMRHHPSPRERDDSFVGRMELTDQVNKDVQEAEKWKRQD